MTHNKKKQLQIAIRRFYSTNNDSKHTATLLGIDKAGFIEHINKYKIQDMSMDTFCKTWGLDHIVPVDAFDDSDITLCYNYNNIMPMFNSDNRVKGASVHFSLIKLETMEANIIIDQLKDKCRKQIVDTYQKYLPCTQVCA